MNHHHLNIKGLVEIEEAVRGGIVGRLQNRSIVMIVDAIKRGGGGDREGAGRCEEESVIVQGNRCGDLPTRVSGEGLRGLEVDGMKDGSLDWKTFQRQQAKDTYHQPHSA
jgi:hypothetical protein